MIGSNKQLASQKTPQHVAGPNHTYQLPTNNEIILNDGEMICDACGGTGWDKEGLTAWGGRKICHKCQGERKLDWVSKITGVPEKDYTGIDSSGSISTLSRTSTALSLDKDVLINDKPIEKYIKDVVVEKLSEKLAERIDEQIIEAMTKHIEQNNKKRRKFFDNRIFSKLMLFCNFKQASKNKKG